MRVIQVINHAGLDRGGAESLVRSLHESLLSRGLDSHLIALEACDIGDLSSAQSLGFKSPYDFRILPLLKCALDKLTVPELIVHSHLFPTSAYMAILKSTCAIKAPIIFTEHSTRNRRRGSLFGLLDQSIYKKFDRICAISEGTRHELILSYPSLATRTCVVQNGVKQYFYSPIDRSTRVPLKILSVGRLVKAKNFSTAIRSAAKLPSRDWHYTILGEGPKRRELQALIDELELNENITLGGQVSNVESYLEQADIFFMPSLWEGFGLAAVEAMNSALPVIASDVPGLRDVTGPDEVCACLVKPHDIEGMSTALNGLMIDPLKSSKLGQAGFKRAKLFTMEHMVDNYQALYLNLLEHCE